ncbi:MAG TPA: bacteriocin ABC transporter permease [Zetaproteobacteria bacterium]|nr:bacteriocin ABC transporter permease [Zetaproteobacteria bacterium]
MIFLNEGEAARLAVLRDADEPKFREQLRKDMLKGRLLDAARSFAALAMQDDQDVDFPLRAARNYQKLDLRADAGRWFLEAARRYATRNYPAQAMATLRLYREMMPGDHAGPREIFLFCRGQDGMRKDFVEMLSDRDRVGYRMRGDELFGAMDDAVFDDLLDQMSFHAVAKGETFLKMGDEATSLFLLARGTMHCFMDSGGQRHELGSLQAGEIYGEVAYFTGGRRTAGVVADSDCEVLELPFAALDKVQEQAPALQARIETLYRQRMQGKQLALAPLFGTLSVGLRERLAAGMQPVSRKAGAVLFREHDTSSDVYLLRQGSISLNMQINGVEQQLKLVETGALVGEMAVLVGWRTATARLMTDCRLMRLDGKLYGELYDTSPELRAALQSMKDGQVDETRRFIQEADREEDEYGDRLMRAIWGG